MAREMNERLDGTWQADDMDLRLLSQFHIIMNSPQYQCNRTPVNVGAEFLRENERWLK